MYYFQHALSYQNIIYVFCIKISWCYNSSSFSALKLKNGQYIINGHRRLSAPGQYEGAGTTFTYKNRASKHCPGECLLADGPTNEDLEVMVIYGLFKFYWPLNK